MAAANQNPGGDGQNQGGDVAAAAAAAASGSGKEYLQFFPEAIRGEKTLEKFSGKDKDEVLAKVATSYVNLEKHAGGAVKIPGDTATPEERAAFWEKLGRPQKFEEYGVKAKVPEGVSWNDNAEKLMLKVMHDEGLSRGQAQNLMDKYLEIAGEGNVRQAQQTAEGAQKAYDTLRAEWGGLTDQRVSLVQRVTNEFGPDGFSERLAQPSPAFPQGLGNDPDFLRFVYALGAPMREANLINGDNLGMKKGDAAAEIQKLMRTPEFLKGDKATIEKIRELTPLAHGE